MKKEIQELIDLLKSMDYDSENAHTLYDGLLERFIKDHEFGDPESLLLMEELINTSKTFWYA